MRTLNREGEGGGSQGRPGPESRRDLESWLVLRAQSGDREAFDRLLRGVQGPLHRCVLSLAEQDAHLAEDVLQEVFLRLWRKLPWLREPALFRPWAYRVAARETLRRLKRERRWREQSRDGALLEALPAALEGEEVGNAPDELPERLAGLIALVSPASRAVLALHYEHGLSLDEVAYVLGVPPGTARSRLAYGLAQLRRHLREEPQEPAAAQEPRGPRREEQREEQR